MVGKCGPRIPSRRCTFSPPIRQLPIPEAVGDGSSGADFCHMRRIVFEKPHFRGTPRRISAGVRSSADQPLKFGVRDLLDENIPHHAGRKFIPFVGSRFQYSFCNWSYGNFPRFLRPTTEEFVPLGCALITFFYFNYQGVRAHGVGGYLKHFAGPNSFLAVLLFPVEIISTDARILSLTVRLWANMLFQRTHLHNFSGLADPPHACRVG